MRYTITSKYYPKSDLSEKVCQEEGSRGLNSAEPLPMAAVALWRASADHMSPAKIITPAMLMRLPEDLTTFQVVNASG